MQDSDQPWLACGHQQWTSQIAWPLIEMPVHGSTFYVPKIDGSTWQHLLILDWTDVDVQPVEVVSPATVLQHQDFQLEPHLGIRLLATGPRITLLQHVASSCFWDLSVGQLQQACTDLMIKQRPGVSAHDLCKALILKAYPKIAMDKLSTILAMRGTPPVKPISPKLAEVLEEVVGADEKKELQDLRHVCCKTI